MLFQTLTGWLPVGDDAAGGRPDPGSAGERRGGPHKGRAPQADGEQEPYRKGSNRETEEQEKVESGVPGPMGSSKPNDRLSVEAQFPPKIQCRVYHNTFVLWAANAILCVCRWPTTLTAAAAASSPPRSTRRRTCCWANRAARARRSESGARGLDGGQAHAARQVAPRRLSFLSGAGRLPAAAGG